MQNAVLDTNNPMPFNYVEGLSYLELNLAFPPHKSSNTDFLKVIIGVRVVENFSNQT